MAPLATLLGLLVALVGARALRAPPRGPEQARAECTGSLGTRDAHDSHGPLEGSTASPLALPAVRPPSLPRLVGPEVAAEPTAANAAVGAVAVAGPGSPAGVAGHGSHDGRTPHGGPRRTHRAWAVGPRAVRAGAAGLGPEASAPTSGQAPSDRPRVLFAADVGGGVATEVATAPDESQLYVSTLAGDLVALFRDGREHFRVALGKDDKGRKARSYVSPAVAADGTVYVGSDSGWLFAIGPEGKVKFSIDLADEVDVAPLLLPNGEVVVAAGKRVVWVDPRGNVTHKFDAKKKVYTAPALLSSDPAKLGADDLVVFGSQDDHVYGVRAATGELVYRTSLGSDVDGAPAIGDDGVVFVGTDAGEVVRLGRDGRVLGRVALGGYVRGPLSIARNGDVVVGTYGPAPKLVRLRQEKLLGAFPIQGTGAKELGIHGGPLEDAIGTLYFGTQDDHVYGVATNGDLVLDFKTGGDVDGPLTLLRDGTLLVPSEDGKVYAIGR